MEETVAPSGWTSLGGGRILKEKERQVDPGEVTRQNEVKETRRSSKKEGPSHVNFGKSLMLGPSPSVLVPQEVKEAVPSSKTRRETMT